VDRLLVESEWVDWSEDVARRGEWLFFIVGVVELQFELEDG
jgi:hypothetical protein